MLGSIGERRRLLSCLAITGLLAISLLTIVRAPVTYIFSDGFESGNFTAWSGTNNSPSIVGIPVQHGNYAAKFDSNNEYSYKTFLGQATVHVRLYFQCNKLPPGQWHTWYFCYIRGSANYICGIGIQNYDGTHTRISFERYYPRVNSYYNYAFSADTWYCFEMRFVKDASNGEYRLWLDGSEVIAVTGQNTNAAPEANEIWTGETTATWRDVSMFIDCVVVNSSYIGPETPADTTPPVYSNVGANSTLADQPCKFFAKWTDDTGLSGCIFSTNNTGTWLNSTWTPLAGLSNWSNVTRTLNSTVGVQVQYRFYCNDTSNNWGSTPAQSLITTKPPTVYHSNLSVLANSSPALVGYRVNIMGALTYQHNGSGVSNAPMWLYYSITGGQDWTLIASTTTSSDGSYYGTWFPMHTGNFIIKAAYTGNSSILAAEKIVNLVITDVDKQMLSVASNSTVSNLIFNSTAKEIKFTVAGPSGTTGYISIFLSRELVTDTTGLKIYFDGVEKPYEAVSVDDLWFIHLAYSHSTHSLRICLPSASPAYTATELAAKLTIVIGIALIAGTISSALFQKKNRGKPKYP